MFRFFVIIFSVLLFSGCSMFTDSDPSYPFPSDKAGLFTLYPNDSAANDSAAFWLARGTFLRVNPQASYTLSFDAVEGEEPPTLHLFRVVDSSREGYWNPVWIKKVEARKNAGRWVYAFDCAENAPARWSAVLSNEADYWDGPVQRLYFTGEGAYGSELSLNIIVAGEFGGFRDSVSIDSAAQRLLEMFRAQLAPGGIEMKSVHVVRASQHPVLGPLYPDNQQILGTSSSQGLSTDALGGWPLSGLYYALDIVVIRQFSWEGVLGLSPIFGGSLGGGSGSTVATATHYLYNGREYQVSSEEWANTTLHETGHFFGLRHTSSTTDDLLSTGDGSIIEDGFTDTPFCRNVLRGAGVRYQAARIIAFANTTLERCPDASNLMFPYSLEGISQDILSASQLQLWRQNLQIMEH